MTYTVRYSHTKKICAFVEALFVEAPGQLPSLPSPKSGAVCARAAGRVDRVSDSVDPDASHYIVYLYVINIL